MQSFVTFVEHVKDSKELFVAYNLDEDFIGEHCLVSDHYI